MSKLGIFYDQIHKGTWKFYTDLDKPEWRFTNCGCVHTAYKVAATTGFYFTTMIYCGWKALSDE